MPRSGLLTQRTHSYKMFVPVLKDILYLTERHLPYHKQKLYLDGACVRDFWVNADLHQQKKQYNGEKLFKRDMDGAFFVKSYRFQVSGNFLTCGEVQKDVLSNVKFLQQQGTPNGEKPHSETEFGEALDAGKRHYSCGKCGKSFIENSDLIQQWRVHTRERPYECGKCGKYFT